MAPSSSDVMLTASDREAMPPALRQAFDAWHRQMLSMKAGQNFQVAHPTPTVVDSSGLVFATMHAVQGLYDAQHLQDHARAWANNDHRRDVTATRISTLMMIIEAKRLDLLEAVLDVPEMSPSDKDLAKPKTGSYPQRRAIFNGACQSALVRPSNAQGPGAVFLEQCKTINPLSLSGTLAPWLNGFDLQDHLEHLGAERLEIQNRQSKMWGGSPSIPMNRSRQAYAQGIVGGRFVDDTNLAGFAVMHGWSEGLRPLLDHRFSPYAHQGGVANYAFALVLACVFNEPACAKILLDHPSFKPMRTFGSPSSTTSVKGLWNILDPELKSGDDWDVLWRSPVQQDPDVLNAMMRRWEELRKKSQDLLLQDPMVHRGVEEVSLRRVADAIPVFAQDARSRPRL